MTLNNDFLSPTNLSQNRDIKNYCCHNPQKFISRPSEIPLGTRHRMNILKQYTLSSSRSLSLMDGVDLIDDFSNISNNEARIINLWTTGNGPYRGQ